MPTGSKKAAAPIADDPWMSVQEAADTLEMSRFKFLQFAMENAIESTKVAGRLVVSRAQVEQLAADRKAAK